MTKRKGRQEASIGTVRKRARTEGTKPTPSSGYTSLLTTAQVAKMLHTDEDKVDQLVATGYLDPVSDGWFDPNTVDRFAWELEAKATTSSPGVRYYSLYCGNYECPTRLAGRTSRVADSDLGDGEVWLCPDCRPAVLVTDDK